MPAAGFDRGFNPMSDLRSAGFRPTSGRRHQKHQDALRRRGLTKTKSGSHVRGDGLDMNPPRGMSKRQAISWIKRKYPGAKAIPSNGGAIHVTFPGWGNAPDISNSYARYGR